MEGLQRKQYHPGNKFELNYKSLGAIWHINDLENKCGLLMMEQNCKQQN